MSKQVNWQLWTGIWSSMATQWDEAAALAESAEKLVDRRFVAAALCAALPVNEQLKGALKDVLKARQSLVPERTERVRSLFVHWLDCAAALEAKLGTTAGSGLTGGRDPGRASAALSALTDAVKDTARALQALQSRLARGVEMLVDTVLARAMCDIAHIGEEDVNEAGHRVPRMPTMGEDGPAA